MILNSKQVAIAILAYADFESLEISLANYSKQINNDKIKYKNNK